MKAGNDGARRTGPALETHYRFLLWLVPTVEKFPKSQKFLLGDRIQATALDVLDTGSRPPTAAAPNLTGRHGPCLPAWAASGYSSSCD
jgi:hypothetical protein